MDRNRLFFRTISTYSTSVSTYPSTVATAAPRAPHPSTLIMMGSRMMFSTDPAMVPTTDSTAIPSLRSRLEWIKVRMHTGAPAESTV